MEGRYEIHDDPARGDGSMRAEADDVGGARLAVETIRDDERLCPPLGIYDADEATWVLYPWGCPECLRSTGRPGVCADCRRDREEGRPPGTTAAEHDRERDDEYADKVVSVGEEL